MVSYWLVDPQVPSITVLELADGRYIETAHARDDENITLDRPLSRHPEPGHARPGLNGPVERA